MTLPITREMFLEWRSPREAQANPTPMNNPVWQWLIRSRTNAYLANKAFSGPSAFKAGPCWCFDRFGRSETSLPDGRTVLIAGEHEDSYDPDFYIYNDVVVIHPDNRIDIYGYPKEDFPPTDFHTATLIDNKIILIGNLGYQKQRLFGGTQVMVIDLSDFSVSRIETTGESPGWIHSHQASLCGDGKSIVVSRGKVLRSAEGEMDENIDDWLLDTESWQWQRLTKRNWPKWRFSHEDNSRNYLFELNSLNMLRDIEQLADDNERNKQQLLDKGLMPDIDVMPVLYQPDIVHQTLPANEDEYNVHRLNIQGVTVRYVQDSYFVTMTVEGELSKQSIDFLKEDLLDKLSRAEGITWKVELVS